MTGKRYRTPAQFRAEIGTGFRYVGEPVPGVRQVNVYEYHPVDDERR